MPRGPRLDAPGSLHHVIARGLERRRLFVDDIDRQDLIRRLAALASLLSTLLPHTAAQCGAAPAEITSSSHRAAAVAGRTLLSSVAVLHLGISSNAVARFLGVTRQSVRRGLQRADQVLPAMDCDAAAILGSVLHAQRGSEPAASKP